MLPSSSVNEATKTKNKTDHSSKPTALFCLLCRQAGPLCRHQATPIAEFDDLLQPPVHRMGTFVGFVVSQANIVTSAPRVRPATVEAKSKTAVRISSRHCLHSGEGRRTRVREAALPVTEEQEEQEEIEIFDPHHVAVLTQRVPRHYPDTTDVQDVG
jgi:hypothetical protein